MTGKRGNPRLNEVRNTDTTAAVIAKRKAADVFALKVHAALIADDHWQQYKKRVHKLKGVVTYEAFIKYLNMADYTTRQGGQWQKSSARNLVYRMAELGKNDPRK